MKSPSALSICIHHFEPSSLSMCIPHFPRYSTYPRAVGAAAAKLALLAERAGHARAPVALRLLRIVRALSV